MGEPGGVGAEILLKAWRAVRKTGCPAPAFFAVDSPSRLSAAGAPIATITNPDEAVGAFGDAIPVFDHGHSVPYAPGAVDPSTAVAVIASIDRAVAFALEGKAGGVVTPPIQKAALQSAGFEFPGHTEYLAHLTKNRPMAGRIRGPLMMLAGPELRTVPVTIHLSVRDAINALSEEAIVRAGRLCHEALRLDFGIASPRIAVSGLNPHAGENGAMGDEDEAIIRPAVERLRGNGVAANGPLPADTLFHERARKGYDAAICMLHDQALIPVKTLDFHRTVNATLGLPIVRTSPDHGTALDIAGKGVADPTSMIEAISLAWKLAAQRAQTASTP